MNEIVEKLKELGLNEYQSKVYVALLKKYPATGYEISKLANIPQSRTYDTLKVLESMHIVISSASKPITYTPIKPKELTKRYKRKFESTLDFLDKKLPDIKEEAYTEPILAIAGRGKVLDKIIEIINNAKKNIYISLYAQDFKYIEHHLLNAYNRGLEIKILKSDRFICNFGAVFEHSGISMFDRTGKSIFVTADDCEGLFAITDSQRQEISNVLWTKNVDIVFLIKTSITYNMYMIDIEENFPEQLKYFYGAGLKKLRDKILH